MRTVSCIGAAAFALLAGCGGTPASPSATGASGGTQASNPLVATWHATRAEFVNSTNSGVKLEVISLGTTMVLTLKASGAYTRTITDRGQTPDRQTGTWSASRDVLTLRPSGVTFVNEFDSGFPWGRRSSPGRRP